MCATTRWPGIHRLAGRLAVTAVAEAQGAEAGKASPLYGDWVLKAIVSEDKPEELLPVLDHEYLHFVFDETTLQVKLKDEAPVTVDYRLKEYPGNPTEYLLQFTRRPDDGWQTTACSLRAELIVVVSDADGLLPRLIDDGNRDAKFFFVFERSAPPSPQAPKSLNAPAPRLDGTWRPVEQTRGGKIIASREECREREVRLTFSDGLMRVQQGETKASPVPCHLQMDKDAHRLILFGGARVIPARFSQDGQRLELLLEALDGKSVRFESDAVSVFERVPY